MLKKDELLSPNSCLSKAGPDEMLFVLLARDPAAPVAINAWIAERVRLGMETVASPKIEEAHKCREIMRTQRYARDQAKKLAQENETLRNENTVMRNMEASRVIAEKDQQLASLLRETTILTEEVARNHQVMANQQKQIDSLNNKITSIYKEITS